MAVLCVSLHAAPDGQQPWPVPWNRPPQNGGAPDGFGDLERTMAARRLKALNTDRQKTMVLDTDKLLRLTQELQQEVSSTNPDSLNPEQMRKIADIEKLAHTIKEKMSQSFEGGPTFSQPAPPPMR